MILSESATLGGVMLDPAVCMSICLRLGVCREAFLAPANQRIWGCLEWMHEEGRGVDVTSVGSALQRYGALDEVGGVAYLNKCVDACATAAHLGTYAQEVIEAYRARRVIDAIRRTESRIGEGDDINEVVSEHLTTIHDVTESTDREESSDLSAAWERVSDNALAARSGKARGVMTPWPVFNEITGGLRFGVFSMILGRSKTRKSYLSHAIGIHASVESETPIAGCYYPLEDGVDTAVMRAATTLARVDSWDFEHGRFSDDVKARVDEAAERVINSPYEIRDGVGLSQTALELDISRGVSRGWKYIVLDAFKDVAETDNDTGREIKLTRWLQRIAKDLGIAVIVVQHVNKMTKRGDDKWKERLVKSDARGASQITDGARIIICLQCQWLRDESRYDHYALEIIANNNGPTGSVALELDHGTGVFTEREDIDAFDDWVSESGRSLMKRR